jgi:hypothetical protein
VLTFAPVSRAKTMDFVKWLGVRVPTEVEGRILGADRPVEASIEYLCDLLRSILSECAGVGIPLGISCESVSIFKAEIDGVHELFRRLQCILLDSAGSPWKVGWIEVVPRAGGGEEGRECDDPNGSGAMLVRTMDRSEGRALILGGLMGIVIGSMTVSLGVVLGNTRRK